MTKQIDFIKAALIQAIRESNDVKKLDDLAQLMNADTEPVGFKSPPVGIEITSAPSLDQLYFDQGSKPILYQELPVSDDDWGYSLDELLAELN